MSQLLLWADAETPPKKVEKKASRRLLCRACKAKLPKKPRSTMPVGHALQTVQGILIERLDDMADAIARIVGEEVGRRWDADTRQLASCAGRIIDALNYQFFPEAYDDGEPYTPDPAGRMDVPANPVGLVPKLPTMAIYARHLLAGKQSPAASLTMTAKDRNGDPVTVPVFTDADLAVLGERQERRATMAV